MHDKKVKTSAPITYINPSSYILNVNPDTYISHVKQTPEVTTFPLGIKFKFLLPPPISGKQEVWTLDRLREESKKLGGAFVFK